MAAPSLAWTATAKADQTVFMVDKLWFKFSDKDTEWNAWATWANSSGNATQKAAAAKFSGRAMDFIVSNAWIKGWPAPDGAKWFEFAKRWAGGCLKDYSSGTGGFCLLEDNGTHYWDCGDIDC